MVDMNIDYTYVKFDTNGSNKIIDWLTEYDGKGHYACGGYGIYFQNEEDATVFALRWA